MEGFNVVRCFLDLVEVACWMVDNVGRDGPGRAKPFVPTGRQMGDGK